MSKHQNFLRDMDKIVNMNVGCLKRCFHVLRINLLNNKADGQEEPTEYSVHTIVDDETVDNDHVEECCEIFFKCHKLSCLGDMIDSDNKINSEMFRISRYFYCALFDEDSTMDHLCFSCK